MRFLFVSLILFTSASALAAHECAKVFKVQKENSKVESSEKTLSFKLGGRTQILSESMAKSIVSGERSLHLYSAVGTSYGRALAPQLSEFLESGFYLSLSQRNLVKQIMALPNWHLDIKDTSKLVYEALSERSINKLDLLPSQLLNKFKSSEASLLTMNHISHIQKMIRTFKVRAEKILTILNEIRISLAEIKQKSDYKFLKRELKQPEWRRKIMQINNIRLKQIIEFFAENPENLSGQLPPWPENTFLDVKDKLIEQLIRKQADVNALLDFWYNRVPWELGQGKTRGLFKDRDFHFTWFASGPKWISRESFSSLQSFFAKNGITFEFNAESGEQSLWDEVMPLRYLIYERGPIARTGLSHDIMSLSGRRIPEDLSRVYVSNPEDLSLVKDLFTQAIGAERLEKLKITFHLKSEQTSLYEKEMNEFMQQAKKYGLISSATNLYESQGKFLFLTESEVKQIKSGGESAFVNVSVDAKSANPLRELFDQAAFLKPKNALKSFFLQTRNSGSSLIEIRPDVDKKDVENALAGKIRFDMRWVSRFYFSNAAELEFAKQDFDLIFGPGNAARWGITFHDISERALLQKSFGESLMKISKDTVQLALNKQGQHLETSHLKKINLYDLSVRQKLLSRLQSSENFGFGSSVDLKKVLRPEEYNRWLELQEFILDQAAMKTALSLELLEKIFSLASAATDPARQIKPGLREEPHQTIWTLAVNQGQFWGFEKAEAMHYLRLPYFVSEGPFFRSSSSTVLAKSIQFAKPGSQIREEVKRLVDLYHSKTHLDPISRAARLQMDLCALHPITDGNGRGTRAVLAFLIMREGYNPPIQGENNNNDWYMNPQEYTERIIQAILNEQNYKPEVSKDHDWIRFLKR